jgi:Bcr/CflA subfamily drug resistance transporter
MSKVKESASFSILLIVLLLGFPQISETIYTPSLPDLAHAFRVDDKWAEFTLSIYFIGFALGVCLWGVIADYNGRRPAMLMGLMLYCLGSLGCFYASSITLLLGCRLVQACGASVGSVVTQTMIRDLYTGTKRNQLFSIVGGVLALSPAIGPLIGGSVNQWLGWRGNFAVLVLMGIFLTFYCYWTLPETKGQKQSLTLSFKQIVFQFLRDKKIGLYVILIGGCNGIIFSYYAEAPFIFITLAGYTPSQYGLFGIIIAVGSLSASWLSHRLNGRRMSGESLILLGCWMIILAALGLTFSAYFNFFQKITMLHLSFILSLIGCLFFGIALIIPNALAQALTAYQQAMGIAGALFGLAYYLVIAGLVFLMGFLHSGSALPMSLYFLLLSFVMLLACYGIRQEKLKFQYP